MKDEFKVMLDYGGKYWVMHKLYPIAENSNIVFEGTWKECFEYIRTHKQ